MDQVDGRRRRRKHSAEFKAKVIAACAQTGVSIAAVALAHKLNANLLRNWVVAAERRPVEKPGRAGKQIATIPPKSAGFVPLQIGPTAVRDADRPITIELRRGTTTIKVEWPVTAAAECTAWLKDALR